MKRSIHTIEYERSTRPYSTPKPNISEKRRYGRTRILVTVLVTIFAFSLTLFAADLLSGRSTIGEYVSLFTGKKNEKERTFYAVYATSTEDMSLAYKNAAAVRAEGGAGYVLKDQDIYYVILNCYQNESDAETVAAKEANYTIYKMIVPYLDADEAINYPSTTDIYLESYLLLYETANDLAAKKYGEEDMKRLLEKQREKVVAESDAYAESIRGKEDNRRIEYKVFLAEIKSSFDNLLTISNNLVADARYYGVMILHSYSLFAKKYAK